MDKITVELLERLENKTSRLLNESYHFDDALRAIRNHFVVTSIFLAVVMMTTVAIMIWK